MKFKLKDYGDKRIVKRFALFPITMRVNPYDRLNTEKVLIWLETVYIKQVVECGEFGKVWKNERLAIRDEYIHYKNKKREAVHEEN